MASKIVIEVDLGNDVMQTAGDVCELLRRLSTTIEYRFDYDNPQPCTIPLWDAHGNRVGKCDIT